ncbi:MAG TPA: hypothetical protein VHW26_08615 [Solirubrobacteraceae bacterium]|jgi:hypothetical protein|nr:hypothetical protein [Solirubrobacteraceae bacterium]
MPTRAVFRCQFCDAVPDHGTQRSLAGQVSERMFGEYLDAFPGRWLVWNGGGPLGPRRYACREHRGDLVAYLRYHYATVAAQVWKMPPYPQRWPDEKRPRMGGSMGIIKFGLRGGLLQDRPAADPAGGPPVSGDEPAPSTPDIPAAEKPPPAGDPTTSEPPAPAGPPQADEPPGPSPPGDDLLFPPGALYLPTDGLFAPDADPPAREPGDEDDDGPWPPDPGVSPA